MRDTKRILLVDGHALAYRAYHALPPMTGPSGEPTNAVLGFANMLLKAIHDYAPEFVAASFDVGLSFRHHEYAEYKATRAETPDDLRAQFGRVTELVEAFGIPIFTAEGYEADDVLGALSLQAEQQGLEAIIVTGDSDTFQLVSANVKVLTPQRTFGDVLLYDENAVRERYGVEPRQLIDVKALTGDKSDNIPGVKGVGEKTATALVHQYGSVEGIYEHLDEVAQPRFRKALEEGRAEVYRSKHLVTIVREIGLSLDLSRCVWGRFDRARVMELLRVLGMRQLAGRVPQGAQPSVSQPDLFVAEARTPSTAPGVPAVAPERALRGEYLTVDSAQALQAMVEQLRHASRLAVDTETTGTDPMRTSLVGISLSAAPGHAWYVPVGHDPRLSQGPQLQLAHVREAIGPLLADKRMLKVCHNCKFDLLVLGQHGLALEGVDFDTMLAAWLVEPTGRGIGLKDQVWQRLGLEMTHIQTLIGSGRSQVGMDQLPISKVTPYACADADATLRLADALRPELERCCQQKLFSELEMPLVPVLASMERHGMAVDSEYLAGMSRAMATRLGDLEESIHRQVGHRFNINSTKQLATVLFEELQLPASRRTQTGYSTDSAVLEELRDKHPIVPMILEYRQLDKIKGTYVDALPELINPHTGRVHTSFNQAGTSTGRLSSSDPNLQNIPVRTELGRQVRGAFVAPSGHVLLDCDYSQVELRLLAHVSRDPELLAAFARGEDVHRSTAAAIFGVPIYGVTPDQRALAKTINFGLMYGMGDYGLSARTDLTVEQAHAFIGTYFQRFQRVKEYLSETVRRAETDGYVETIMGRRRYFPELRADSHANPNLRRAAERAAINMPIQGSAADIIKLAMILLHGRLVERGLGARMLLQVHDELLLEVPKDQVPETQAIVVETMAHAYTLDVPLLVQASVGANWMETK